MDTSCPSIVEHTSVIEQPIDATEIGACPRDHGVNLLSLGNVHLHDIGFGTVRSTQFGCLIYGVKF